MNAYDSLGQKRFDSGSVTVSYYSHIAPAFTAKETIEDKVSCYRTTSEGPTPRAISKTEITNRTLNSARA